MLNYIIYRIGKFIALTLPLQFAYKLAIFVSDLHSLFVPADRRAVRGNLKAIFPEKSAAEIEKIRKNMPRNFAKYLVNFFRFSKLDSEYIKKNIQVENLHYFEEALKKGKGVIALTAHLGNWELGGIVISLLGYPLWVVALPHKNNKVNEFFNKQRESKGVHVIPFGKAARQCLNMLKENKIVALVGDRDFTNKGVPMDFFGKKTLFPLGAAAFMLKTNCVILPGFMVRTPEDNFVLKMEKPLEPLNDPDGTMSEEEKQKAIIRQYITIFEDYIKKYPDQWYMFKRFWME